MSFQPRTTGLFPIAALAFLGLAAIGMVIHALTPAIFPDELQFFQSALKQVRSCAHLWCPAGNDFGYASLWWDVFAFIARTIGAPAALATRWTFSSLNDPALKAVYAMRLLDTASLIGAVGFAAWTYRHSTSHTAAILSFLCLPLVWWNGRWAGPDFAGVAAAIIGMVCLLRHRPKPALLLWGMATAFRLTNGVELGGFMILAIRDMRQDNRHDAKTAAIATLYLALGYLIANPDFLLHPQENLAQVIGVPVENKQFFDNAYYLTLFRTLLIGTQFEWDMPTVGSLTYFSGGIFMFLVTLASGWALSQRRILTAALAGTALCLAAILIRGRGYGWYFMPGIAATYIGLAATMDWRKITSVKREILMTLQLIGLGAALIISSGEWKTYLAHAHAAAASAEDIACMTRLITARPAGRALWLNLDPAYTILPMQQGSDAAANIFPMNETMDVVGHQTKIPQPGKDYYVTSDFMRSQNPWVIKLWAYMLGQGTVQDCGPFHIIVPDL